MLSAVVLHFYHLGKTDSVRGTNVQISLRVPVGTKVVLRGAMVGRVMAIERVESNPFQASLLIFL